MKKLSVILIALAGIISTDTFGANFSGTLPVMYIDTENNAPVLSKDEYVRATCYIDNLGLDGYESSGSADNRLSLQIKGRGNYTWWGFDKKPYRLKLDTKAPLLGMKKNKHFALLANADDNLGFLRNAVGFELSRQIGLAYTPEQRPVEVVLNGDYIGLYFLVEHIRVDENRVNIAEQDDNETDPEKVTGGWLVEIDNYEEDAQIRIQEGNGETIRFTYKSPEVLSSVQSDYLRDFVTATDRAIYNADKSSTEWEKFIDIDSLVCFYIVQEIVDNAESFHGSCYFHKHRGDNTPIVFGPVWDFGNSFQRTTDLFIYQYPPFGQTWIGEITKYPRFREAVKRRWREFYASGYQEIEPFINRLADQIGEAAKADASRWPDYGNPDMQKAKSAYLDLLKKKTGFLLAQWGQAGIDTTSGSSVRMLSAVAPNGIIRISETASIEDITACDLSGKPVSVEITGPSQAKIAAIPGVYILSVLTQSGTTTTAKIIVKP